ncbi:hypothetical protein V5T82_12780 [Magnetovibrio sp. PR-2]|uniref:hypothetical protein n=1 Tax=Magnetovibrio sp. PR-2 TaxID=3120356 RepID=UPI002FCE2585
MASHTAIAANLLRNAATFFRDIGTNNPDLKDQMEANAETYDTVAEMLENDPDGELTLPSEDAANGNETPPN